MRQPRQETPCTPPAPHSPSTALGPLRAGLDSDHHRPAAQLRQARRLLAERGQAPAELLGTVLARSWQRSQQAGLPTQGRVVGAPHASAAQLARAMERQYELISHARPVMEYMAPHVHRTGSLIILADAQGMLLQAVGDDGFAGRAERVALRPGAQWGEPVRGTNAIGTALAEVAPVVIHGGEHYLERNGFLTCAAAPIIDPAGRLLGAIDISGDHRGYHPSALPHTLALASAAARMVEHRLFDTWHAAGLRLRFHTRAEGIGTLGEGLLAVADDGTVIGANSPALEALGLQREQLGRLRIDECLACSLDELQRWAYPASLAPRALFRADGQRLWVRLEPARGAAAPAAATARSGPAQRPVSATTTAATSATTAADPLAALDTGDAALHTTLARARRVLDKPISLLVQGESGSGKEVLARALHASGPRRDGPFVAVTARPCPTR